MWPDCQCGRRAKVYAMDPIPNGWADYYCYVCKPSGWITDILGQSEDEGA